MFRENVIEPEPTKAEIKDPLDELKKAPLSERINKELGIGRKAVVDKIYLRSIIQLVFTFVIVMILLFLVAFKAHAEPLLKKISIAPPITISTNTPNKTPIVVGEESGGAKTLLKINGKHECKFMADETALTSTANPDMVTGICFISSGKVKIYLNASNDESVNPQKMQEAECEEICAASDVKKLLSK